MLILCFHHTLSNRGRWKEMKGTYISWMVESFRILWTCLFTIGFILLYSQTWQHPSVPCFGYTRLQCSSMKVMPLPFQKTSYCTEFHKLAWFASVTHSGHSKKIEEIKKGPINFLISNGNEFYNSNLLKCIYILCSFKPCLHHIILPINKPTQIWCIWEN